MKIIGESYRDATRLEHMQQAIRRILSTAVGLTRDQLYLDDIATRALMYDFTVLGEAANNISEAYCSAHPEVPWSKIAGFRHKLIHDYAGVEYGVLWEVLQTDIPVLKPLIDDLVSRLPPPEECSDLDKF